MSRRPWIAIVAVAVVAGGLGGRVRAWFPAAPAPGEPAATVAAGSGPCSGGAEPLYWKAPMDPTYVRDKPGKSPMGMDLVPVCPDEAGGVAGSACRKEGRGNGIPAPRRE